MPKAILWDHNNLKTILLKEPYYIHAQKLIDCQTITSIQFTDELEAYVDDEGLLIDDPLYGAVYLNEDGMPIQGIAGRILFVNHNEEGETISLTDKQIEKIEKLTKRDIVHKTHKISYPILIIQRGK